MIERPIAKQTRKQTASGPMSRWLSVLDAFTLRDKWGVRELATHLAVAPSVSHRLLHDMERQGLLVAAGDGKFSIGPELARLSVLLAEQMHITKVARPVLEEIAQRTGETIVLAQYSPHRRQYWAVEAVESAHPIRYMSDPLRTWSDLHVGAGGRAILAFLEDDERRAILDSLPDPLPGPRSVAKENLDAELALARRRGFIISHAERFAGAVAVSAPIRDGRGKIIGALICSWPDNRTDGSKEEAVATTIAQHAAAISHGNGYRPELLPQS